MTDSIASDAPDGPLVPVTLLVPTNFALEFQRRALDLLDATLCADMEEVGGFAPLEPSVAVARFRNVWQLPAWGTGSDDVERAQWVWDDIAGQERLRGVVMSLIANSDGAIGATIANDAGYNSPSGLPPALKHLAMRCRRAQRRPMWTFSNTTYTMTKDARDLFARAAQP